MCICISISATGQAHNLQPPAYSYLALMSFHCFCKGEWGWLMHILTRLDYVTYTAVHAVENSLRTKVEGALEEEHGRGNAHEVGGRPPEDCIVQQLHCRGFWVLFKLPDGLLL